MNLFRARTRATSRPFRSRPLALEPLEDRSLPSVVIAPTNNNGQGYAGLDFNRSTGFVPPDTCGAAGPSRYVETVNQTVALYGNKATGTPAITSPLSTFWFITGGLAHADAGSGLSDPIVTYNDQIGRFIVGDQDVNFSTHVSTFDVAVSTTSNPATLGAADWKFYQINTTESGYNADYPGNFGYNHDAFVFTLNMFGPSFHVLVVSVNNTDLANGVPQAALGVFNNDVNAASLRPAAMHDSAAGDPMWLVTAPSNSSIDVIKMTGVLSTTAGFAHNFLSVAPHSSAVNPRNPNGTVITNNMDSRIQKVGEWNNLLVASQTVGVSATEDDAQWYAVNVGGATPIRQDQGRVSAGPNTYIYYPSVDVNAAGQIGMTYMKSGTDTTTDFMSMYVTGRTPGDPAGTMEAPVLVPAGTGQANYRDFTSGGRAGDLSGINVDPVDGSFWAANEFANTEATANWGTAVANFTLAPVLTINGTPGNDTITVHNQPGNPANVEVIVNGASVYTGAWSGLGGIIIAASSGNDTVNIDNAVAGTPITVNLGNGTDTVNARITSGSLTITGGGGADTLVGPNAVSTWQITGSNAGTLNGPIAFSGIQNLTGGSAADTFVVSDGTGVAGAIDGGGGSNTLDDSAYTTPVAVDLSANTATGVGGTFANLQSFIGSGGGGNTLHGPNTATTWNVTGSNAGTLTGGISFSAFQNLTGGAGNDAFVFSNGAGVAGNLDGGGGVNTLNEAAYTPPVTVNLQATTATGVGGSFANLQNFVGSSGGGNGLVGTDVDTTWNLSGSNAGTLTGGFTFTAFQNLTGGAGNDTFVFANGATVSGTIDGGGGTNTLNYAAYSTTVVVDLQTNTGTGVVGSVLNIQNVTGGTGGGAGVYNILVGNGGNVLTGGDGRRNLLIAGGAASTLLGGNQDDILIGGTTAYDTEAGLTSLNAIMAYWSGTADDYPTRVGNLTSGTGVPILDATTVTNNGGGNTLTGNNGGAGEMNLFYGLDPTLETTDYNAVLGEVFINC